MTKLSRLRDKNFLVVGRAGMDFYADPPGAPIVGAAAFTAALGGSSANIAAGLCRLGCSAALVTSVSDDAVGRYCLGELQRYGIDSQFVRIVGGELRTSLAVVETRLENTQGVIYRNGAADFAMSESDIRDVPIAKYSAVIATGTALAAEPSRQATLRCFDMAVSAGTPVVLDLDYRPYSWPDLFEARSVYRTAAAKCDIVVGNDEEFAVLAGNDGDGLSAARNLVANGASVVVYKRGEKGAVTISHDGETATGIFPTKALKPTGAGDAFMAGFLSGLADGLALPDAVRRGSANAAIVVSRVGCAPAMATPGELTEFMAQSEMSPPLPLP